MILQSLLLDHPRLNAALLPTALALLLDLVLITNRSLVFGTNGPPKPVRPACFHRTRVGVGSEATMTFYTLPSEVSFLLPARPQQGAEEQL